MRSPARVVPFGESSLLVELGDEIDELTHRRVLALRAAIDAIRPRISGSWSTVPGYTTLLVSFDADVIEPIEVRAQLVELIDALPETSLSEAPEPSEIIEIPVRYGGSHGPDLVSVADRLGQHPDDVVSAHLGAEYRVFLLGFAPGFAYLGSLPQPLRLPRRSEPRVRVPAGSVAIAEAQTAVYPFSTPGGWHLIGNSEAPLWDLTRPQPSLLSPGDRVRFVAI